MLYPRTTKNGRLIQEEQMVRTNEHFLSKRVLFLTGLISGDVGLHDDLLALDSLAHKPIKLAITSPGGDLDATFLLYDTIRLIKSPVWTFGRYCASAACLVLAAGKKRYLSPHAKVMLHLPFGKAAGDARDWDIQHREMAKYRQKMVEILIECGAKRDIDQILKDIDRDFWLEPAEAVEYGLVDAIMTPKIMKEWLR